jgi:hypothetical protein
VLSQLPSELVRGMATLSRSRSLSLSLSRKNIADSILIQPVT